MNNQPAFTRDQKISMDIHHTISLKDKNWFQTGGTARYFCEPNNGSSFQEALNFADKYKLPIFVLGQGANVLISDDGFDGLIIRPQLTTIETKNSDGKDVLVTAGAGVTIAQLIDYCLNHNILGLEEFSGIPGTVGGSVYINLHYFEFLLDQFLVHAQVIDKETHHILSVTREWFNFGYNMSRLLEGKHYLVNATFKLKQCSPIEAAYARGRSAEIIRHRLKRYPHTHTCGSFFRNFNEHEIPFMIHNKKIIYVAYYLDKIGIKGHLSHGDAMVSHQHANMIVNRGSATSNDIIQLARRMQELVIEQFGITPQPECQFIGFSSYPLLLS